MKPVAKFKPGGHFIQTLDHTTVDFNDILYKYVKAVILQKNYINEQLRPLYGKDLNIADKHVSDIYLRIKDIKTKTGKTIQEIGNEIRNFIPNCSFYRVENKKLVTVEGDRILKAYLAIKDNKSIQEVKNILYK